MGKADLTKPRLSSYCIAFFKQIQKLTGNETSDFWKQKYPKVDVHSNHNVKKVDILAYYYFNSNI